MIVELLCHIGDSVEVIGFNPRHVMCVESDSVGHARIVLENGATFITSTDRAGVVALLNGMTDADIAAMKRGAK